RGRRRRVASTQGRRERARSSCGLAASDLLELGVDDVLAAALTRRRLAAAVVAFGAARPRGTRRGVHRLADLLQAALEVVVGTLDGVLVAGGDGVAHRLDLALDVGADIRRHLVAGVLQRLLRLVGHLVGAVAGLDRLGAPAVLLGVRLR